MSNLNFDDERVLFTPVAMYCEYINFQFSNFLKKNYKDITPRDFTYLANILYHQDISQRELSELLFVSESNVTQIIKKLEKKGFVTRQLSEENKSRKIINLTQKGKFTVIKILTNILSWEEEFENNFDSDDFKKFKRILYDYADKSTYED